MPALMMQPMPRETDVAVGRQGLNPVLLRFGSEFGDRLPVHFRYHFPYLQYRATDCRSEPEYTEI